MITANSYLTNKGLGNVAPLPSSVTNYKVPIPSQTTPVATTSGGGFWDSLTNIFTKVNTVAQQAAPLVTQVKSTVDVLKNNTTNQAYNYGMQPYNQAPQAQPMSNTKKVLIGAGIAAAAGTAIYFGTKKKK